MAEEPATCGPTASPPTTTRWLRIGAPVLLILVWLVGGALGGPYFGRLDEVATNDQSSFLPASAEATRVAERLPDFLGDDHIPAVVVATSRAPLDADQLAALATGSQRFAAVDGVADVSAPIPSQDGLATQTIVTVDATADVAAVVTASS